MTSIASVQKILEKYERNRIKADNDQQLDQYFVFKGKLHYIGVDAAKVCERYALPIQHLQAEEEFILNEAPKGDSYDALTVETILDELGINSNNGTEGKKTIEVPQSFWHAVFKLWPPNTWKKKVAIFVVACFLVWTYFLPDGIKTTIISHLMNRITNHPKLPPKPDVKGDSSTSALQPEVSRKPEIKKTIPQQRPNRSDSDVPKSATHEKMEEGIGKDNGKTETINAPNALIVTKNQSGGTNTVNQINKITSQSYQPLSVELGNRLNQSLGAFKTKYRQIPRIVIEVESGSSSRDKVARVLENHLMRFGLGSYPKGNTFMGRFPQHPVTVFCNSINTEAATDFVKSISAYLTDGVFLESSDAFPKDFMRIYLYGTPIYSENGAVKFE